MTQAPAEIYTEYRGLTASALLPLQLCQTCAYREHNQDANEAEPTGYAHRLSQDSPQRMRCVGQ